MLRSLAVFPILTQCQREKQMLQQLDLEINEHAPLGPVQTGNVWRQNSIKHCFVTKHFNVWPPCLVLFDRV